jgi:hypothetical protein
LGTLACRAEDEIDVLVSNTPQLAQQPDNRGDAGW